MIENYRTDMWRLMRNCAQLRLGLRRAGFTGGRLADVPTLANTAADER